MVGQDAAQIAHAHLARLENPPATVSEQVWAAWEYSQTGARVEARYWLDVALTQQPNHSDAQRLQDHLDASSASELDSVLIRSRSWLSVHPQASDAAKQVVMDRVEFLQSEQVRIHQVESKLNLAVWLPLLLAILLISLARLSIARLKV